MTTPLWRLNLQARACVKRKVLKRDGLRCQYCGKPLTEEEATVDHVIPLAAGGTNGSSNLVVACEECNVILGAMNEGFEGKRQFIRMLRDLANVSWY